MKLKPVQFTVFAIWAAMCMSQVAYAFVVNVQDGTRSEEALTNIFALVAGCSFMMTFVLRVVLLGGFRTGKLSIDTPEGRARFIMGNIVIFALSESIGVLGLINGLNSRGETDAWLPFIGGAFILLLLHIPLPSRFEPQSHRI